jgi:hypothetical protein
MATDRTELKRIVLREHNTWDTTLRRAVVYCPWCGEEITDGFDLHEFLVKRSAVPRDKQDLIMVLENVAPVHHQCHMRHGQTKEMTLKCYNAVAHILSPGAIGEWYVSLWRDHELSLPRGILYPPATQPIATAMRLINIGLRFRGVDTPGSWMTEDGIDVRGPVIQRWKTGRGRTPNGLEIRAETVASALNEGYWLDYLAPMIS